MGTLGGRGGGGRRDRESSCAACSCHGRRERGGFTGLAHNSCQSTLHRSQWKFIFPIGYISFRIRLDSMLKLIWNYINPNGFAVRGIFLDFFSMYCIQHCFICRPSDSAVSEDAGIEPRTVATSDLAVRRSKPIG